ncbi:hypothetical protein TrCOL_g3719 [Triparma columacea]|uniref:Acyltransferase n=1 Tax=Triparma columacea TaxID=722753 RepID=A0A9W7GD33_9STRA|nr:hypothetical protein TrCOL_g3719 [Triparma columacea]
MVYVEKRERACKRHADPVSWFGLLSFFGLWCGSPVIPLAAVTSSAVQYSHKPLLALIGYYSYKALFPSKPWAPAMQLYRYCFSRGYFRTQTLIIQGEKVKRDDKTLLGFHPHGALCCGWTLANASDGLGSLTTGMKWLVAPLLFKIPLISEVLSWNSVASAEPSSMKKIMSTGQNVSLLPGGFHSASLLKHGAYRCYVLKRKGFIKYSLQYGYKVRPCFSFGEEKTYWTLNWFEKARMNLLAARNIPPVWFLGKYGILPFDNIDITLVVGEAIQLPKIEKPTKEDVDKYHALYVAGLRKVFDENKKDYATEDAILELQ